MLQRVEAEVGQVGGFGMAEDAKDAALVLELIHWHSWLRRCAPSWRFITRALLAACRCTVDILRCSALEISSERRRPDCSASRRGVDRRPPSIEICSRAPPVRRSLEPARRLAPPAAQCRACAAVTETMTRDADSRTAPRRRHRGPAAGVDRAADATRVERALRERDADAAIRAVVRRPQSRSAAASPSSSMQRLSAARSSRGGLPATARGRSSGTRSRRARRSLAEQTTAPLP